MTAKKLEAILKRHSACNKGYEWVKGKTLKKAWETCQRGDWMMWLYKYASPKKDICVRIAIYAAESCIVNWTNKYPDDNRPQLAIQAAKEWLDNPSAASAEWSAESAESAESAAWSVARSAARSAASAALSAAWSAESAAWSAEWSAARSAAWSAEWSAARSAEWSAESAASAELAELAALAESAELTAWSAARAEQADYIRTLITWKDIEDGLK